MGQQATDDVTGGIAQAIRGSGAVEGIGAGGIAHGQVHV